MAQVQQLQQRADREHARRELFERERAAGVQVEQFEYGVVRLVQGLGRDARGFWPVHLRFLLHSLGHPLKVLARLFGREQAAVDLRVVAVGRARPTARRVGARDRRVGEHGRVWVPARGCAPQHKPCGKSRSTRPTLKYVAPDDAAPTSVHGGTDDPRAYLSTTGVDATANVAAASAVEAPLQVRGGVFPDEAPVVSREGSQAVTDARRSTSTPRAASDLRAVSLRYYSGSSHPTSTQFRPAPDAYPAGPPMDAFGQTRPLRHHREIAARPGLATRRVSKVASKAAPRDAAPCSAPCDGSSSSSPWPLASRRRRRRRAEARST